VCLLCAIIFDFGEAPSRRSPFLSLSRSEKRTLFTPGNSYHVFRVRRFIDGSDAANLQPFDNETSAMRKQTRVAGHAASARGLTLYCKGKRY
jgi:hypothetical protein